MNPPKRDDSAAHQQLFAGLAFSGTITASVTHELNNVLGTIEQITGLIEDLAITDAIREAGISDKLLDVVGRVNKQTDRGTSLIKHLNGFAHLSDDAVAECDLGELVERMVTLSTRFARMRKVELTMTPVDRPIVINSSPFQVAQAIFGGIRKALQMAKPPEPIQVGLVPCERGAILAIEVSSDNELFEAAQSQATDRPTNAAYEQIVEPAGSGVYRIKVMLREES